MKGSDSFRCRVLFDKHVVVDARFVVRTGSKETCSPYYRSLAHFCARQNETTAYFGILERKREKKYAAKYKDTIIKRIEYFYNVPLFHYIIIDSYVK